MEQANFPDDERVRSENICFPRAATGLSEELWVGKAGVPVLPIMHNAPAETRTPAIRSLRRIAMDCQRKCEERAALAVFHPSIAGKNISTECDQTLLAGIAQVLVNAEDFLERFQ